jgi:hypothetical protein
MASDSSDQLPGGGRPGELAPQLRRQGTPWWSIASQLRKDGVHALQAMRLAHDWDENDAATAWNALSPPPAQKMTPEVVRAYERWPGPGATEPPLSHLIRFAEAYECDVSDLVEGLLDDPRWKGPRTRNMTADLLDAYERWPDGGIEPPLSDLMAMAVVYHCDIAELVKGFGEFRHLDTGT